jgi:CPA2 family monovalent cation:H+ antiporter-2
VLVAVLSIVFTPFILRQIGMISTFFFKERSMTEEFESLSVYKNHIIICGYGSVGKYVAKALREQNIHYIIVDNSYQDVKAALDDGEEAFYGDMSKGSILEKLHASEAASVIVTLDNIQKKRLICEAVLVYAPEVKVVVKVVNLEEKRILRDLPIHFTVDGKKEVAQRLVREALHCEV